MDGDSMHEWIVMLTARSSVRLLGDPIIEIEATPESTAPVQSVRMRNAYFAVDGKLVFKGLIVEARGQASSAVEAVALLAPRAAPLLQLVSTAANASVDEPRQLLVYAPPHAGADGRFLEQRPCGHHPPAATVRSIAQEDLAAVLEGLLDHPEEAYLQRAMAHFRQAVTALDPLNRVMSAEHLWMASENLGHAVFRRVCRDAGLPPTGESKHVLAVAAGFAPTGQSRQHLYAYDSHLRVLHIFGGDKALYDTLRRASDAFEHGFGDFGAIQADAHASVDAAFGHVRRAILTEAGAGAHAPLHGSKYEHVMEGWQPRIEIAGGYQDARDTEGWPYFYGTSLIAEISALEDLDDDQARRISFQVEGSAASLIQGQALGVDEVRCEVPLPPDRTGVEAGEPEIVVTRADQA